MEAFKYTWRQIFASQAKREKKLEGKIYREQESDMKQTNEDFTKKAMEIDRRYHKRLCSSIRESEELENSMLRLEKY